MELGMMLGAVRMVELVEVLDTATAAVLPVAC